MKWLGGAEDRVAGERKSLQRERLSSEELYSMSYVVFEGIVREVALGTEDRSGL